MPVKSFTMIEGFEEITAKLSDDEKKLIPVFVSALSKKIGVGMAVTAKEIEEAFKKKEIKVPQARVRKLINFIRMNCLVEGLVASSKGYYVSRDPAEIMRHNKSLEQREAAIRAVRKTQELYLLKLLK